MYKGENYHIILNYKYNSYSYRPKSEFTKKLFEHFSATNIRELPTKEDEIREEIYRNGPVSASLVVYLSFLFYEEGTRI